MPILATGKRDTGFTLVELMAVIAIIALASAAVVLAMPQRDGRTRIQAERFAARVALARDLAITGIRATALTVDKQGYRIEQRKGGIWQPLEKPQYWRDGVRVQSDERPIVFDTIGLTETDRQITLTRGDERTQILIAATGDVRVSQ